jgi:hypothetical protein
VLLSPEPDEMEEQRHLKGWSGGKFDPERFDVAMTDKAVGGAAEAARSATSNDRSTPQTRFVLSDRLGL